MNFPPFWAKEKASVETGWRGPLSFECWGWSNLSLADARQAAQTRAARLVEHFRVTRKPPDRYAYGTRPLREQVLRTIRDISGQPSAILSRNQYGCVILNTARAMFVDIDIKGLETPARKWFSFFGKPKVARDDDLLEPHLVRVERWTSVRPEWGWRIYRTRGGLRLLATHSLVTPQEADSIFEALGADPLYRKLCANQDSFRARLTPKPWRLGMSHHAAAWPWPDAKREARFKRWEEKYLARANDYATCRFLKCIGRSASHPELAGLIEMHDQTTRAESGLPLA